MVVLEEARLGTRVVAPSWLQDEQLGIAVLRKVGLTWVILDTLRTSPS